MRLSLCLVLVLYGIYARIGSAEETKTSLYTQEEIQWMREKPRIRYTGVSNGLPFEVFDRDGKYIGIVADHLDLIAPISGLEFQRGPSKSWSYAKAALCGWRSFLVPLCFQTRIFNEVVELAAGYAIPSSQTLGYRKPCPVNRISRAT